MTETNNIVVMNRGDSYTFNVNVLDTAEESGEYIFSEDDVIYFGVMLPHQKFEDAIIKKVIKLNHDDSVTINLVPSDTVDLEPGIYYYTIKLRQHAGESSENVITIINKTKLVIND